LASTKKYFQQRKNQSSSKVEALDSNGSGGGIGGGAGSGGFGDGYGGWSGNGDGPNASHQLLFNLANNMNNEEGETFDHLAELKRIEEDARRNGLSTKETSPWLLLVSDSEDYDSNSSERQGTQRCVEIEIKNFHFFETFMTEDQFRRLISIQEGLPFNKADLENDVRHILARYALEHPDDEEALGHGVGGAKAGNKGLSLDVYTEYIDEKTNRQRVTFIFRAPQSAARNVIRSFQLEGSSCMPPHVQRLIAAECIPSSAVDVSAAERLRQKVEEWYTSKGLPMCYVGGFEEPPSPLQPMDEQGNVRQPVASTIRAFVTEPTVRDVRVVFVEESRDARGQRVVRPSREGRLLSSDQIKAMADHEVGALYRATDTQHLMNRIYATGFAKEVTIQPIQPPQDPEQIHLLVRIEEAPLQQCQVDLDWAFRVNGGGLPQINRQSLIPGGSVEVTRNRIFGRPTPITLSLQSSDWRAPMDDLGYAVSYSDPFFGKGTKLAAQVFSTQKASSVFAGKPGEVQTLFVSRFGTRAAANTEIYDPSAQKRLQVEHALAIQRIASVDDQGQMVPNAAKSSAGGFAPRTCLNAEGRDLSLSYSGFVASEQLRWRHGVQVGTRSTIQVDQGLNPNSPFDAKKPLIPGLDGGCYNRIQVSHTETIPLPGLPKDWRAKVGSIGGGVKRDGVHGQNSHQNSHQNNINSSSSSKGKDNKDNKDKDIHDVIYPIAVAKEEMRQGNEAPTFAPLLNLISAAAAKINLKMPKAAAVDHPTSTLVLHAKAGAALGDLPPYEAFSLGGPFSVRGYSHGELGAAKRYVEAAAEVRVPLAPVGLPAGTIGYAFLEGATDLGSGAEIAGNPSEYFRKPGSGVSYGVGVKALGAVRLEYARDCNQDVGNVFLNFGERF